MKIVVAHSGARRGYAVPSILEAAGLLEAFYTDICADVSWGRFAKAAARLGIADSQLKRLASRRLPPDLVGKTKTFARPTLRDYLAGRTRRDPAEAYRKNLRWQCRLGDLMAREGFGNANFLHAFLDEFPTLLLAARDRGLKVVSELYILLSTERLLAEERKEFPGWELDSPNYDEIMRSVLGKRPLFECADYALCPSEAVRDDAVANFGFSRDRAFVVPFGVSDQWFQIENRPVEGRVLFVGSAELRKGIHYLATAAEALAGTGRQFEFRVAGNVECEVESQKVCRYLTFLGRVPRDRIAAEFATADVFVLPSLAEGSAGVTYEALAAGVPVITTKASGSVVRDGIDGRIVSERNVSAISQAIAEIVEDRDKRARMAEAARERAKEYTWHHYGERLVATLRSMPQ